MRWTPGSRSRDIEDRRGQSGFGMRRAGAPLGIGGILVLLVLSVVFRQDFLSMLGGGGSEIAPVETTGDGAVPDVPFQTTPEEEELVKFVSFVLDDVQNTWTTVLPTVGTSYQRAKLVLFREAVDSACGFGQAAMGPFYCSLDQRVYIDLAFYDDLHQRFGAPGDFAQAYVLAHEIGHHVQNLLGIQGQVRDAQQANPDAANELSVLLELQADCFAGVWGHSAAQRGILDAGDLEEGLNAARAIGDDLMMKRAGGRVVPEAFTHGSSAQRVEWLRRGLASGRCEDCDTFNAGVQ
jgi:predicted metalloprotease